MQDFYTPNSKLCQFPLKSKSITKFLEQFQFRPTILGFEQGMFRRNRSQPRTRGCYEVWTEPRIIRNEQLLEERWEHSSLAGYDGDEAGAVDAGGDLLPGGRRREPGGAPPPQQAPHGVRSLSFSLAFNSFGAGSHEEEAFQLPISTPLLLTYDFYKPHILISNYI